MSMINPALHYEELETYMQEFKVTRRTVKHDTLLQILQSKFLGASAISNQIFHSKLFLRIQITLGTVHSLRYLCISIKGLATKEQYILKSRPFIEKLPPFF